MAHLTKVLQRRAGRRWAGSHCAGRYPGPQGRGDVSEGRLQPPRDEPTERLSKQDYAALEAALEQQAARRLDALERRFGLPPGLI
jgi:hypothetical protein